MILISIQLTITLLYIYIYIYVETKYLLLHLNMITPLDKNAKKHKTQKQKGVKNKC